MNPANDQRPVNGVRPGARRRQGGSPPADTAPLHAVFFDMDGTLVDSERLWDAALFELARRYGGRLSDSARARMVGMNMPETLRILHEDIGQEWRDPTDAAAWLTTRMDALFASELAWRPGARELLTEVRAAGLRTALVTTTGRRLVESALNTIGRANFDLVVTGDDVVRTKPDPQPYRTAAALLRVKPRRCVVIEDSSSGVSSARAAGCVVLAVRGDAPLDPPAGLHMVDSLVGVRLADLRRLVGG